MKQAVPIRQSRLNVQCNRRRGAFALLMLFFLVVIIAFAAVGVDYGYLAMNHQRMQNAVDAAALAAAMEITAAIETAGPDVADVVQYAKQQARQKAAEVAALNGVFVDPDLDVEFGRRIYNPQTGNFEVQWNQTMTNLVRVVARRDNPDRSQPDGLLTPVFSSALGWESRPISVEAAAFVEARDIVCVIDFSRSMNFDSFFSGETGLSNSQIESNLELIWNDLGNPTFGNLPWYPDWVTIPSTTWGPNVLNVRWQDNSVHVQCSNAANRVTLTFADGNTQAFTVSTATQTNTWAGTGSNSNKSIHAVAVRRNVSGSNVTENFNFYDNNHISRGLGLTGVAYPWPQGSWAAYYNMVRNTASNQSNFDAEIGNAGFRKKFGIMTFLHYQLRFQASYDRTPDFWKTRHYPFHCVKEGQSLLCDFLEELSFNDYVGFVSYDTYHRQEHTLNSPGMPAVNISSQPITNNYQAIRDLINHKQAGHYFYATNIGGGLKSAKQMLDQHGRPDARPTILLMTDGHSNTIDAGENTSLPAGWNWSVLFDYDGDGVADYSTSDVQKRYVLIKAKECVDAGYTIHSMVVGSDGDRDLMRAVAHLGRGVFLDIPGGSSVQQMQAEVLEAFNRIASFVPPATLLPTD
ncbi:MAG TPA: VWA domain-containing protein [Pirellulaceae bacterium]|nr:VWA domain-containing protein [Pirellulaceae bacterium]HMO91867.1 VWA domain-containing protein [Pirellulaceae bacterium]HMP69723.1 VWA domain-containing protein [Pirellulaceae bacterium]